MNLIEAITSLDPARDDHWTDTGLPRLSALKKITGNDNLTRAEVSAAAPDIKRELVGGVMDVLDEVFGDADEGGTEEEEPTPSSVLDKPLGELLRNYELSQRALAELNEKELQMRADLKALQEQLDQVAAQAEVVERAVERHKRLLPSDQTQAGIRAYLQRQAEVREERARRRQVFLEQGVSASEVAAELRGTAPIDAAMQARRQGRGTTRPTMPVRR
jgi:hypothetical protein